MTLYEINDAIMNCVDEETGEIIDFDKLEELEVERSTKIENIALYIKNARAEAEALKTEIENLQARKKRAENEVERTLAWIGKVLNGENFKTSKVDIRCRKSKRVKVDDDFIKWAMEKRPDILSFAEPQPNKKAIKEAISNGEDIEHALVEKVNNVIIK